MILAFDLDDTLYDEMTFVRSGFTAVASHLSSRFGLDEGRTLEAMLRTLDEQGRGAVFDTILEQEGLAPTLVNDCLSVYRGHAPDIELAPGAAKTLERHAHLPLYLVTDGDPGVQGRKINALGIETHFKGVYRTWSYGLGFAKPSLHCFEMISSRERRPLSDLVYVGDDPSKDFVNLRRVGSKTIRVLTGRHANVIASDGFDADHSIADIADLDVGNVFRTVPQTT